MGWLLRTVAIGFGKAITLGEYNRIKKENRRHTEYGIVVGLLDEVAKKRLVSCRSDELSGDCPIAMVIPHYHQKGRTSDGTAPLRIYTIIGSGGQIINIQGFDLMQTIKITVRHANGHMETEDVDPSDAMKRIRWEAGIQ